MTRPLDAPEGLDAEFEIDLLPDTVWAMRTYRSVEGEDQQRLAYGLITTHRCTKSPSGWRAGSLAFDLPQNAGVSTPKWTVNSLDPLDLSPSVQHNCGCPLSHGYIRAGRWVGA